MKLLQELHDSDIFPGVENQDPTHFTEKRTARAVIFNKLGHVGLLCVDKYNYHKLPGGGIEQDETPRQALRRELLEEMGRRARIITDIGKIVEWKNQQARKQISYCYLTRQYGESVSPNFTDSEKAHNYQEVWVDLCEAIELIKSDQPIGYSRKFIQARELIFLQAAAKAMQNPKISRQLIR